MRNNPIRTLALAVSAALAGGMVHAQDGIEDLGTFGGTYSVAYGVSADGSVVVGEAAAGSAAVGVVGSYGLPRAFLWTRSGGMVDLGALGGPLSEAYGVSADGSVVVGKASTGTTSLAFRWTSDGGMVGLGTLPGGTGSAAWAVSADGTVVVGSSGTAGGYMVSHAFRWTSTGGMTDLGTLGGTYSSANAVSADGSVVVGEAHIADDAAEHAFRWTSAGMVDLGTLGGTNSGASGISADGTIVVGTSDISGNVEARRAFRWTSGGGMTDLGTLGGGNSRARGISADGAVVVGGSHNGTAARAFRWTQATGMQSIEDWLRAAGVTVASDITSDAFATNADGSVVVGELESERAFIARVAPVGSTAGSGLIALADIQHSLAATASGGNQALTTAATLANGAHSRPLSRRVAAGRKTLWAAGDWGRDDHGSRSGDLGLAEVGGGLNLGPVQFNVSLGRTWARQDLTQNGRAKTDGRYLLAEALIPIAGNLWVTAGGYVHRGDADLKRGYLNAGTQDFSTGRPDVDTWGLRARLDWENAYRAASVDFSPYIDLTRSEAKLAAYTETGGGFPVRFDSRKDRATELRLGMNVERALTDEVRLVGLLEAAHRFERHGARTTGQVVGLFGFDLPGEDNERDWLRAGIGAEGRFAGGTASLMLNGTSRGEVPSAWLAAGWQRAF